MHIHSVPSGFGTNSTGEPKLLREGWIQLQRIALSICLQSSSSSHGEMRYGERNGILPFGSILISKSVCLPFCEFAYVGSLKRPWNSVNMAWNSPGGSVGSVLSSPRWCTLIKKADFNRRVDTFLSSAFRMMWMPMSLACSTIPSSTSKGRRPGK